MLRICTNTGSSSRLAEPLEQRRLLAGFSAAQVLWEPGHVLTGPSARPAIDIGAEFVRDHASRLGLARADLAGVILTDQYTDSHSGVTHLYFRQQLNGLPIAGADMGIHVLADGSILSVASSFLPGIAETRAATAPVVSSRYGLTRLAKALELPVNSPIVATASHGLARTTTLTAIDLSVDPIVANLQYLPTPGGLELAWNLTLRTPDGQHWYDASVSATTGHVLTTCDWVNHAAYNAMPFPQRYAGTAASLRQVVFDPHDPLASPFGWHDNNGAPGPEFFDTRGNNVFAQEDADGNNIGGFRPSGGESLTFDFPLDLSQAPSSYTSASVTNVFYWSNLLHDVFYRYGFTESAGNFQTNNYGRGGVGNDALQADAQDGGSVNNASFACPPDGQAPRMQLFPWSLSSPNRDGSFEPQIIVHEYGHGVTSRLTGGPANANALQTVQSAGMAEGWSDFFALALLQTSADQKHAAYPLGNYVSGQPQSGVGIRRVPYSFDMSVNPLTIDNFGVAGTSAHLDRSIESHDTGEIWASALWDMNWLLIDKYGFEPDMRHGFDPSTIRGNTLALQLVLDGLKLQPTNPSFATARDAILQADQVLTGGANQSLILAAFARRGMGAGFDAVSTDSTTVIADFSGAGLFVRSIEPVPGALQPIRAIDVHFSQPVDPASLSIDEDVLSLLDDAGQDLRGRITGVTWIDDCTARIGCDLPDRPGSFQLTLGRHIATSDGGSAMDNDLDGRPGELPDDLFMGSVSYRRTIGPEGAGLSAAPHPFQDIDLVAGNPGVVSLISSTRDLSSWINLGTNTFNFYGTTYTGNAAIAASSHGLLTFGALSSSPTNSDLRSAPSPRAIAVLWDDWRPDINVPGYANSAVLFRIEDVDLNGVADRLIVEWSDVPHTSSPGNAITFQAILELNTGARPGRIILNYPDIDAGAAAISNGASATIGIKDFGPQGGRRLLINKDSGDHPWISSGAAVVIGPDVTPPSVLHSEFEYLTGQRFVVSFSEDVGASLQADDWVLTNTSTRRTIEPSQLQLDWDPIQRTAVVTPLRELADGEYEIRIPAGRVTDAAGNPLEGGDFAAGFFVLGGDANRDRVVDVTDLAILATHWQQSPRDFSQGDFNYDQVVDISDLSRLASAWHTRPAPTSPITTFFTRKSTNRVENDPLILSLL